MTSPTLRREAGDDVDAQAGACAPHRKQNRYPDASTAVSSRRSTGDVGQIPIGFGAPEAPRAAALRRHHVRSHQTVEEAQAGELRAARQQDVILSWFGWTGGDRWTPSEVHTAVSGGEWPLTSTRRALTNLTKAGKLVHHPHERREGPFGVKESTWSAA